MTIPELELVVGESGKMAKSQADLARELNEEHRHAGNDSEMLAAQWMQVKILAEIALQLKVANDMNNEKQNPLPALRRGLDV